MHVKAGGFRVLLVAVVVAPALACANRGAPQALDAGAPAQTVGAVAPPLDVGARTDALLREDGSEHRADAWRALGPQALASVESALADRARPMDQRVRGVFALAFIVDAKAEDRLKALVADASSEPSLRAAATEALAWRDGKTALDVVQPLLADADATLRGGAVKALAFIGGPDAQALLESRIEVEPDPALRELIQHSLGRMQP